ncbi:arsinothricin resistance N-acetyltransferase ArsN1 family B [Novosphingobium beihaiensis]|uniref:N-acetyltransferase family protein n=1 Tax=Novosphingobium beihaiensis TaxID=2930389 RepID=A0ABT0BPZ4_9SPHN|nr:arsinothricin resistance N-acetyltransferase ArsN1 family B [Novosphingobium beihaiensis]MCJ2187043.1 N-acetyltransferase family protein [Novosphingobium beihaiensis]
MRIRPAAQTDAAACAAIYAPFVESSFISFETEAPDAAEMARRIAAYGESHAWLIAEASGQVAGYAYASAHRARAAYASSCDVAVYVDPDHARQGIGKALYEALFLLLKDKGLHAAFAGIALPNPGSVGLHEAMGFTPVGIYREVGWKLGAWRDVGWWQRLL